jgi:hypothetical protein
LLVDYGANRQPLSARCSACYAQMPLMESKGASSDEGKKWFTIQFDLHVRQKHPREDLNEVAVRLVREATKD